MYLKHRDADIREFCPRGRIGCGRLKMIKQYRVLACLTREMNGNSCMLADRSPAPTSMSVDESKKTEIMRIRHNSVAPIYLCVHTNTKGDPLSIDDRFDGLDIKKSLERPDYPMKSQVDSQYTEQEYLCRKYNPLVPRKFLHSVIYKAYGRLCCYIARQYYLS